MCAVPGGDDTGALAAGPGREMLEVEIPAGGARTFRVDVQVRVEAHPGHASFAPSHAAAAGESGTSARPYRMRFGVKRKNACGQVSPGRGQAKAPPLFADLRNIDSCVTHLTFAVAARR